MAAGRGIDPGARHGAPRRAATSTPTPGAPGSIRRRRPSIRTAVVRAVRMLDGRAETVRPDRRLEGPEVVDAGRRSSARRPLTDVPGAGSGRLPPRGGGAGAEGGAGPRPEGDLRHHLRSSGRPDSNRRHSAWKADALPTELRPRSPDHTRPGARSGPSCRRAAAGRAETRRPTRTAAAPARSRGSPPPREFTDRGPTPRAWRAGRRSPRRRCRRGPARRDRRRPGTGPRPTAG